MSRYENGNLSLIGTSSFPYFRLSVKRSKLAVVISWLLKLLMDRAKYYSCRFDCLWNLISVLLHFSVKETTDWKNVSTYVSLSGIIRHQEPYVKVLMPILMLILLRKYFLGARVPETRDFTPGTPRLRKISFWGEIGLQSKQDDPRLGIVLAYLSLVVLIHARHHNNIIQANDLNTIVRMP